MYICPIIINMNHFSFGPFKTPKRICEETHIFPVILNYPLVKARLETKYYLNISPSKQNLSPPRPWLVISPLARLTPHYPRFLWQVGRKLIQPTQKYHWEKEAAQRRLAFKE